MRRTQRGETGGEEGPKASRVPGCHCPYDRLAGRKQAQGVDQKPPTHSAVSHRLGNFHPDLGQSADSGSYSHDATLVGMHDDIASYLSGMSGPPVPGKISSARRPSRPSAGGTDQYVERVQPATRPGEPTNEPGVERAAEPIEATADDLVHG